MKILYPFTLFLLFASPAYSASPLSCTIGPIHTDIAATTWQVTSCDDGQSLVFATVKGNPAMPFVFFVQRDGKKTNISGEGNGAKKYTAKVFAELKSMTAKQFEDLVQATKSEVQAK